MQEKHDEFRHPVEQQFPMKQRLAHDTWILEFTWRVKDDTLITVWYIRESDTLRILDKYILRVRCVLSISLLLDQMFEIRVILNSLNLASDKG